LLQPVQVPSVLAIESFQFEAPVDKSEQQLTIEGLLQKVERIFTNRANQLRIEFVNAAGHENNIHFRVHRPQLFRQVEAIQLRHLNVQDGEIWLKSVRYRNGFA